MAAILERPLLQRPTSSSRGVTPAAELDSRGLLQGRNEILIRHGNEVYRLRHTRNDKLILTK